MSTRMFSEEQLEQLRSFPDIGRDDLTCAKFVTTGEYALRLRARLDVEQALATDAADRGWAREAERHRCTSDASRSS